LAVVVGRKAMFERWRRSFLYASPIAMVTVYQENLALVKGLESSTRRLRP
jgi:hypothetical protein